MPYDFHSCRTGGENSYTNCGHFFQPIPAMLLVWNLSTWTAKWLANENVKQHSCTHTHIHTRLTAPFLGLPGWVGTRKAKPIWILLKQETVSGSGISWAICKSAPRSRQITTPAPHYSVFYRPDAPPAAQPTASKQRRPKRGCNQMQLVTVAVTVNRIICIAPPTGRPEDTQQNNHRSDVCRQTGTEHCYQLTTKSSEHF